MGLVGLALVGDGEWREYWPGGELSGAIADRRGSEPESWLRVRCDEGLWPAEDCGRRECWELDGPAAA